MTTPKQKLLEKLADHPFLDDPDSFYRFFEALEVFLTQTRIPISTGVDLGPGYSSWKCSWCEKQIPGVAYSEQEKHHHPKCPMRFLDEWVSVYYKVIS